MSNEHYECNIDCNIDCVCMCIYVYVATIVTMQLLVARYRLNILCALRVV